MAFQMLLRVRSWARSRCIVVNRRATKYELATFVGILFDSLLITTIWHGNQIKSSILVPGPTPPQPFHWPLKIIIIMIIRIEVCAVQTSNFITYNIILDKANRCLCVCARVFKAFQSGKRLISIYCMQIYKQMIRKFAMSSWAIECEHKLEFCCTIVPFDASLQKCASIRLHEVSAMRRKSIRCSCYCSRMCQTLWDRKIIRILSDSIDS